MISQISCLERLRGCDSEIAGSSSNADLISCIIFRIDDQSMS
jgi:hypothetical protein